VDAFIEVLTDVVVAIELGDNVKFAPVMSALFSEILTSIV
jgi:hypothetical protein